MLSLKKYGKSPVSLETLLLRGAAAHGQAVWDGTKELRFDFPTGAIVSLDEFRNRQKQRSQERAESRKPGRRPSPLKVRQSCPSPDQQVARPGHGAAGYFVRHAGL